MTSEKRLSRREWMKAAGVTTFSAILAAFIGPETTGDLSRNSQTERLQEAGLGSFVDFYQAQAQLYSRYGVRIFSDITDTLVAVAGGVEDLQLSDVSLLAEGWTNVKDSVKISERALEIAEEINLHKPVNTSHEREALKRLAITLPGLLLLAPPVINFDNKDKDGAHINYNRDRVLKNPTPDFDDTGIVGDMHAYIHELSHPWDGLNFGMDLIDRIKPYIPKDEFAGYMAVYTQSVFNILNAIGRKQDIGEILVFKGGDPLVLLRGLPGTSDYWRDKGKGLAAMIGKDESWIIDQIGKYNSKFGKKAALDEPGLVFNVPLAYYLQSLYSSSLSHPKAHNFLTSEQFNEYKRMAVEEVVHYLVGPAYGSLDMIVDAHNQFNEISLESARLDGVRLEMFTAQSDRPSISAIKDKLYPELNSKLYAEAEKGVYPWKEGSLVLENAASYEGRVFLQEAENNPSGLSTEFRAYGLPPDTRIPGKKPYLIIAKTYDAKADPLGINFDGQIGYLISVPDESRHDSTSAKNAIPLGFSPQLSLELLPSEAGETNFYRGKIYKGTRMVEKTLADLTHLEHDNTTPGKIYMLPVEVGNDSGDFELHTLPCIGFRSFRRGGVLTSVVLPDENDLRGNLDLTKSVLVTDLGELRVVNGMGVEPFTSRSKCVLTDNVTTNVGHFIDQDGQLHIQLISQGYTSYRYAIETTLTKKDTDRLIYNGLEETRESLQIKSRLRLNFGYDTRKTNYIYAEHPVYQPPYTVEFTITGNDKSTVEMKLIPKEVVYKNVEKIPPPSN